jgi:hypothetical protein
VRRGDASSCSYASPGTRKKNQAQGSSSPDDMQNRIDRLEGLVLSLMTNGAQSAGPAAAVAAVSRSTSASGPSPGQPQELDLEDNDMIKEEGESSEVDEVSSSFGALKVDAEKGKAMYWGDSHWHLVLADVRARKYPVWSATSCELLANASCRLLKSKTTSSTIKRNWSNNTQRWRPKPQRQLAEALRFCLRPMNQ